VVLQYQRFLIPAQSTSQHILDNFGGTRMDNLPLSDVIERDLGELAKGGPTSPTTPGSPLDELNSTSANDLAAERPATHQSLRDKAGKKKPRSNLFATGVVSLCVSALLLQSTPTFAGNGEDEEEVCQCGIRSPSPMQQFWLAISPGVTLASIGAGLAMSCYLMPRQVLNTMKIIVFKSKSYPAIEYRLLSKYKSCKKSN
jgi:hypothetical protein